MTFAKNGQANINSSTFQECCFRSPEFRDCFSGDFYFGSASDSIETPLLESMQMDLGIRQIQKILAILCLIFVSGLQAEQTVITNYDEARDNYFYDQLYTGTIGESLYCGITRPISAIGKRRTLEHVMPAQWMAEHFSCPDRDHCNNTTYKHAEADLHNLWLAVSNINSSRSNE